MDEVDQIILDQLNQIGCSLDADVKKLDEIDIHDLVNSFIKCVTLIDSKLLPKCKFSENQNISDKYRIATELSNAIKELGYKADIGYQTFLYFNEKESRRLFLFLFDKLSKQKQDEPKQLHQNLLQRLKNIKINFKEESKNSKEKNLKWKTEDLDYLNFFMRTRVDDSIWLPNPSLFIEWNTLNLNPDSKLFSKFSENLKLTINKNSTSINYLNPADLDGGNLNSIQNEVSPSRMAKKLLQQTAKDNSDEQIKSLNEHLKRFEEQLEESRVKLKAKKSSLEAKRMNLERLNSKFDEKKMELGKVKYSDKSNEELKDGIKQMKSEINEVNTKWDRFLSEYEEQTNELKEKKRLAINKFNELNEEIMDTKNQNELYKNKLKKLDELTSRIEQNLGEDNDLDRKFYTKRIFEIINNVKKQEQDINNILNDIRNLQREINHLIGKVTRTYTVVEEIVFKNQTDWSRRCYRLISELDEIYDKLVNEIESSGQIKREVLRFEDILEGEKSNKIGSNLSKVIYDLEQIRKSK